MDIGRIQTLKIDRIKEVGAYLTDEDGASVLLPKAQIPKGASLGDEVEVFIYRDSMGRPIATVNRPYILLGEIKSLVLKNITRIGGFLDWGLEKDLFMPFREMTGDPAPGDSCTVRLYLDRSNRLCATMKISGSLKTDHGYKKNDMVKGTVYRINPKMGIFVAVDDKYSAMVPISENNGKIRQGDAIEARVREVREDGKIELTLRKPLKDQIDSDADKLLKLAEENGGALPVTEKDSPEDIREYTGMSKAEFKRAVGSLLKQGRINITDKITIK